MSDHRLIRMLMRHEGFSSKVYLCPAGYLTIGFGRNIETNGINEAEAMHLLMNDIASAKDKLDANQWFSFMNDARQAACINLVINIGYSGFLKFRKMIQAFAQQNYEMAACELNDSSYAKQVPNRCSELTYMIKTGKFQE